MGTKRLKELAQLIAEKHNLSKKQSKELVQDIFDEIQNALGDGDRVVIRNFASFAVKDIKPAQNSRIISRSRAVMSLW